MMHELSAEAAREVVLVAQVSLESIDVIMFDYIHTAKAHRDRADWSDRAVLTLTQGLLITGLQSGRC